ncbi:MAG TPA: hypothetical protein VGL91_19680 [Acidobacteriota bacterium]
MIAKLLLCFGIIAAVAIATVTWLCGQMFHCGCAFTEGMRYCNVHRPMGPRCPWCSSSFWVFNLAFGAVLAATAATIFAALKSMRPSLWVGLPVGLASYILWVNLMGLFFALLFQYPIFYGARIP